MELVVLSTTHEISLFVPSRGCPAPFEVHTTELIKRNRVCLIPSRNNTALADIWVFDKACQHARSLSKILRNCTSKSLIKNVVISQIFNFDFQTGENCLRINLNGVDSAKGKYVSLFVHLMKARTF